MEAATFRQWLTERGCSFEAGKDTAGTHGHAYVTVRRAAAAGERSCPR